MTQEEIRKNLIKAALSGREKKFDELAEMLDNSVESRTTLHFYENILLNNTRVKHNI